ncbi:E1A [Bat mastadenovirus WIV17]|uniref:E1A n=1 Tax=Bat mastadenovirus WIV17 TaxID=1986505 RepID=A0A1X9RIQ2_9ADEN|nr:E1A [Bat mastadenovirus WIV17]ARQ79742.1 E1A [Bat mastadenovirus WIV17]
MRHSLYSFSQGFFDLAEELLQAPVDLSVPIQLHYMEDDEDVFVSPLSFETPPPSPALPTLNELWVSDEEDGLYADGPLPSPIHSVASNTEDSMDDSCDAEVAEIMANSLYCFETLPPSPLGSPASPGSESAAAAGGDTPEMPPHLLACPTVPGVDCPACAFHQAYGKKYCALCFMRLTHDMIFSPVTPVSDIDED